MRSLPHVTIACAAVWAGSRLISTAPRRGHSSPQDDSGEPSETARANHVERPLDYRLVALGSLLPDMIDRGIRAASRRKWSRDQHLLGHTLLLNAPVVVAGINQARRRRDARLLGIGAAAMTHLLVDPVIRSPQTLLWPLFGLAFPESRGLSRPLTLLTQIAAAAAVLATIIALQRRGRLNDLIVKGAL